MVRRVLGSGLVAGLALAAVLVFVAGSELTGPTAPGDASSAPAFLTKALGPPQAGGRLVRRPARDFVVDVSERGFSVRHSGRTVSLASTETGSTEWTPHARGFTRPTPFGRETITTGADASEQFLTVDRRLGPKTWRWRLSSPGLEPRITPSGEIRFFRHDKQARWRIARPLIQDEGGRFLALPNLGWSLRKRGGKSWLELKLDDSKLPIPYTIDPGIAIIGSCAVSGAQNNSPQYGIGCGAIATQNVTAQSMLTPIGILNGDVMILHFAKANNSTVTATPSGWTQIGSSQTVSTLDQRIYYRVVNGDTPGATTASAFTYSTSADGATAIVAYSGVDTTVPVDTQTSTNGTTTGTSGAAGKATANSVTTRQANDMVLALYSASGNIPATALAQDSGEGLTQEYTWAPRSANASGMRITGADMPSSTPNTAVNAAANPGDTSLTVLDTTGFPASGTLYVGAQSNAWSSTPQVLTYTGRTATSFTGIPASGAGSITSIIPLFAAVMARNNQTTATGAATPGTYGPFHATINVNSIPWASHTVALQPTLSADGSGTMSPSPTSVTAGSTGNTITFTYTAATGGMSNGAVELTVPTGWSAPSLTGLAAGYTTASTGTVGVSGQVITVSGVTLAGGATMTIIYGSKASGGPGATAATTAGSQTWTTRQKSTSGGNLTTIASQPSITVGPGPAAKLVLTGSASQTAGTTNGLTLTAYDQYGNTASGYTGDKSLTFSGASDAPDGTHPNVTPSPAGSPPSRAPTTGSCACTRPRAPSSRSPTAPSPPPAPTA